MDGPPYGGVVQRTASVVADHSARRLSHETHPHLGAIHYNSCRFTGGHGGSVCSIDRRALDGLVHVDGFCSAVGWPAPRSSSGAGGLYGFLPSTWQALGFSGLPENASVAEQNAAFQKEYAQSGTSAWSAYDGC